MLVFLNHTQIWFIGGTIVHKDFITTLLSTKALAVDIIIMLASRLSIIWIISASIMRGRTDFTLASHDD